MNGQSFTISTVLTANSAQFDKTVESSKKKIDDLAKSDLSKVGANLKSKISGVFDGLKDKGKETGLGSFVSDLGAGTTALGAFAGPAAMATGAILGIGAATVSTGKMMFDLARDASEFGSALYDMQQKTGLAADTISAMDLAATQSGTSLETVSASTAKFSKLIAEAAGGSKEAQGKLKALGVTSNDLETALGQAYKTINGLPEGFQQMTAAQDAFGKSGADLIPYIHGMDGDLDALKDSARKLGVTLTDEDLAAADAFGDTLDLLGYQAKVTSAKFALEFAPVITGAMNDVSSALSANQETVRGWGKETGKFLSGLRVVAESEMAATVFSIARATAETTALYHALNYIKSLGSEAQRDAEANALNIGASGKEIVTSTSSYLRDRATGGAGSKKSKGKSETDKASDEFKRLEDQLRKTINEQRSQLCATVEGTKATDASNVAYDLQLKGFDKLIPSRYKAIVALAREKDAISETVETVKKLTDGYKSANEKYTDFVQNQLKGIAAARGEANEYADAIAELEKNVFSVISTAQNFKVELPGVGDFSSAVREGMPPIRLDADAKSTLEKVASGKILNFKELAKFARENGFTVTSTNGGKHNDGSNHYRGLAVDIRTRDKTAAQIAEFIQIARAAGVYVKDERRHPKGQKVWGGPHLHIQDARITKRGKVAATGAEAGGSETEYFNALGASSDKAKAKITELTQTFSGFNVEAERAYATWLIGENALSKISGDLQRESDDLSGVVKTTTETFNEQVVLLKAAGVQIEDYTERNLRLKAAAIDLKRSEDALNEAVKTNNEAQREAADAARDREGAERSLRLERERAAYNLLTRDEQRKRPAPDFSGGGIAPANNPLFEGTGSDEYAPKMKVGVDSYWRQYRESKERAEQDGGIFDPKSLGVQMDALKEFKATAMDCFGGIAEGLGSVLETWILTGEMSGEAIAQMTASVIAGVAAQAAVKAIFEVAEGLAALANPFTAWQAPMHFAAAKTYGLVALGATAIGAGIGAAGGLGGKKNKNDESAFKANYGSNNSDQNSSNFVRQSSASAQQNNSQAISDLQAMIANLNNKISSMKPGDVLTVGAQQKKGFILETATKEANSNSTGASKLNRAMGN